MFPTRNIKNCIVLKEIITIYFISVDQAAPLTGVMWSDAHGDLRSSSRHSARKNKVQFSSFGRGLDPKAEDSVLLRETLAHVFFPLTGCQSHNIQIHRQLHVSRVHE